MDKELREQIARVICCFAKNNKGCSHCKYNTLTSPFPDCFPDTRSETDQILTLIKELYPLLPKELPLISDEELNKAFDGAFDKAINFDHKPTPEEIVTLRFRAIAQAQRDHDMKTIGEK